MLEQLKMKNESLKKALNDSFREKDILHKIIDNLLESGGYNINTASKEEFEKVYADLKAKRGVQ